VWYYARILHKRNSIISLEFLPYFYALSPNCGEPDEDYLMQYEQGLLPLESKLVYEALLKEGPLDTISLRKAARMANPESTTRFNHALEILQIEFKILPTRVAEAGAWRYAFVYDLTHRYFPQLVEEAGRITEPAARKRILTAYFKSLGAAEIKEAGKIFRWRTEDLTRTVNALVGNGTLVENVAMEGSPTPLLALRSLLETSG
jgi:uncharacterized protein YcaQ